MRKKKDTIIIIILTVLLIVSLYGIVTKTFEYGFYNGMKEICSNEGSEVGYDQYNDRFVCKEENDNNIISDEFIEGDLNGFKI